MNIREKELSKYQDMWSLGAYGDFSPGENSVPLFTSMVKDVRPKYRMPGEGTIFTRQPRVLDAGAGSGKGAVALQKVGFDVTMMDITDNGLVEEARSIPFVQSFLWDDIRGYGLFDWVYCCDVMEHIPPQFTMLVVHQMLKVAKHGLFLSISTVPDSFGVWIGQPLHLTVHDFSWWRDNLSQVGNVLQGRDLLNSAVFLVEVK